MTYFSIPTLVVLMISVLFESPHSLSTGQEKSKLQVEDDL